MWGSFEYFRDQFADEYEDNCQGSGLGHNVE